MFLLKKKSSSFFCAVQWLSTCYEGKVKENNVSTVITDDIGTSLLARLAYLSPGCQKSENSCRRTIFRFNFLRHWLTSMPILGLVLFISKVALRSTANFHFISLKIHNSETMSSGKTSGNVAFLAPCRSLTLLQVICFQKQNKINTVYCTVLNK